MSPLISVIVPVYNVQDYLKKCLDSISAQTMRDIEIIIINDGTKDSSREIAVAHARTDPRIILIDQENQGLGYARNTGLNVARGRYVAFVDSDDWLDIGYLEAFYLEAERNEADLVIGSFFAVASNEREVTPYYLDTTLRYRDVPFHWTEARQIFLTPTPVWDKFYRRSLIEENGIRFVKLSSEDIPFKWQIFTAAKRISTLPEPMYNYRVRSTSITGGKGNAIDVFRSHDNARRYLQSKGLYEELYPEFLVREVNELIYLTVKAKQALLGDPLFFSAFHALLCKALCALDFNRARHIFEYISDEYLARALYVRENDSEHDFKRILSRSKDDLVAPRPPGVSVRLWGRDVQVAIRRAESVEPAAAVTLRTAPEFFKLDTTIACTPERYPDEPNHCPAFVADHVAYLLPPVYDPTATPAEATFTLTARRAVKGVTCMVHTHQRERQVAVGAELMVNHVETGTLLARHHLHFPVTEWYKRLSVRFEPVTAGTRIKVTVRATNAGEVPAHFSGVRAYNFIVE